MDVKRALLSLLQLFTGFSFFSAAVFFFVLPYSLELRLRISYMLISSCYICQWIGGLFLLLSLLVLSGFYLLNRSHSLTLKMGNRKTTIEPIVVRKMAQMHLDHHFPNQFILSSVAVTRKGILEMEVSTSQPENLALLHEQMVPFLKEKIGYAKPLFLRLSNS